MKNCLNSPYVLFVGDIKEAVFAKTGLGVAQWCPNQTVGQIRFDDCEVDLGIPDTTLDEAISQGAKSLLIGAAPVGGVVPDSWWPVVIEAAQKGLDIVSGLHGKLSSNEVLAEAARQSGIRLIDIRRPPDSLPVGSGKKRTGCRVLMVGTDCAVGKKYTALALAEAMTDEGMKATFRATGQTGIMIAGEGIPIDAVVADFIAGAAEMVSPDNDADHWDVVEGQGSLFHPGYAGVALGLLHGSQPDAIVVCHDVSRESMAGWGDYSVPRIQECIDLNLSLGARTNPDVCCVGVSVNTSCVDPSERQGILDSLSAETGLPVVDPLIDGCLPIVERIRSEAGGGAIED